MTSRVSFYKLTKQALRQRLWYGALLFLGFFICFPLAALMSFNSRKDLLGWGYNAEEMKQIYLEFQRFVGGSNYVIVILAAGAALLGAWSGLSWLHSRRKMDMLGSLPVRREKLYLSETVASVLLYVIPYAVNLLLALLVGVTRGILTGKAVTYALFGLLTCLLFYLAIYAVASTAMLLTGKILTGILGTAVLLCIAPAIGFLVSSLPGFLETYVEDFNYTYSWISYLSPLGSFLHLTDQYCQLLNASANSPSFLGPLLDGLAFMVVFFGISIWLVRIRPSEGAEHSMVFPKTEGVFKAIMLYPLVIGGGCFFISFTMGGGSTTFWLWFGVVFVAIVSSILIEVIYHFDRKRLLAHNGWTIAGIAAAAVTLIIFVYDLTGYDTWMPDVNDVKSVAVLDSPYSGEYPDGSAGKIDFMLKNMDGLYDEAIFDLAQEGIENVKNGGEDYANTTYVVVFYKMKNGTTKMRGYYVSAKHYQEILNRQMQCLIFRQAQFPILLASSDQVESVSFSRYGYYESLDSLSHNDMEELVSRYQQDLMELSWEEISETGGMSMEVYLKNSYYYIGDYPVNEHFTHTVEFLEEKGLNLLDTDISDLDVTRIVLYQDIYDEDSGEWVSTSSTTLDDPEEIAEALEGLVETYYYGFETEDPVDFSVYAEVNYVDKDHNPNTFVGYYLEGMVPDIITR